MAISPVITSHLPPDLIAPTTLLFSARDSDWDGNADRTLTVTWWVSIDGVIQTVDTTSWCAGTDADKFLTGMEFAYDAMVPGTYRIDCCVYVGADPNSGVWATPVEVVVDDIEGVGVADVVRYYDSAAAGGGDGSASTPWNTVAAARAGMEAAWVNGGVHLLHMTGSETIAAGVWNGAGTSFPGYIQFRLDGLSLDTSSAIDFWAKTGGSNRFTIYEAGTPGLMDGGNDWPITTNIGSQLVAVTQGIGDTDNTGIHVHVFGLRSRGFQNDYGASGTGSYAAVVAGEWDHFHVRNCRTSETRSVPFLQSWGRYSSDGGSTFGSWSSTGGQYCHRRGNSSIRCVTSCVIVDGTLLDDDTHDATGCMLTNAFRWQAGTGTATSEPSNENTCVRIDVVNVQEGLELADRPGAGTAHLMDNFYADSCRINTSGSGGGIILAHSLQNSVMRNFRVITADLNAIDCSANTGTDHAGNSIQHMSLSVVDAGADTQPIFMRLPGAASMVQADGFRLRNCAGHINAVSGSGAEWLDGNAGNNASTAIDSDYNQFSCASGTPSWANGWSDSGGGASRTLAQWQADTSQDANSSTTTVPFTSGSDLDLTGATGDGAPEILLDDRGMIRSATVPSRGAFEYAATLFPGAPSLVPDDPSSLVAVATGPTSVGLAWSDNSDNEDAFEVQYQVDGSSGWVVWADDLPPNTEDATITGLAYGTLYNFRVRATNVAGESAWITASATTQEMFGGSISAQAVASPVFVVPPMNPTKPVRSTNIGTTGIGQFPPGFFKGKR